MPHGDKHRVRRDLRKCYETLPKALWDGVIEAGKTNAGAAFGLQFFHTLQDGLKDITPEQRAEAARILKEARFEDIEATLLDIGIEVEEQRSVIREILTALARNTTLIDGFAPVYEDLLAVVSRLDALPQETRDLVADQLTRLETRVERVGEGMDRTEDGVR